jgi:hypothetical protein
MVFPHSDHAPAGRHRGMKSGERAAMLSPGRAE